MIAWPNNIVERALSDSGSQMLFVIDPELIWLGDQLKAKKNHKNINYKGKY